MTMLATERKVSASTHNQALSALLFLYREVLSIDLPWLDGVSRPAQKRRIPSVLTKEEVAALFQFLNSDMRLLAQLLYGTGMRLLEGLRLRIKDVDFDRHVIIVREAKGNKDRVVMLPRALAPALRQQLFARPSCLGRGPAGAARRCANTACAGAKISSGRQYLGVVLVVSIAHFLHRPAHRL